MTVKEVLQKARDLISDPARWAKGWFAYDADGYSEPPCSPFACKWCVVGAVRKVINDSDTLLAVRAIEALKRATGRILVGPWNDAPDRTHAEVLAAFDTAIAEASN